MPNVGKQLSISTKHSFVFVCLLTLLFLICFRDTERFQGNIRFPLISSQHLQTPISVVVLFHKEYETFNSTLATWEENGLVPYISQLVIFMNGMTLTEKDSFFTHIPRLKSNQWRYSDIKLMNSESNIPLGIAIGDASQAAKHDIILLLEKDWALIESGSALNDALELSTSLIIDGKADAVRLRNRDRPGIPDFGRINSEGHEDMVLMSNKPTVCNFHKWMSNLDNLYPEIFSKCGESRQGEIVWCTNSEYCEWTNNPVMFKKSWYHISLRTPYEKTVQNLLESNPNATAPVFENWVRYDSDWEKRQYNIALPQGLFEHKEIGEESFFNKIYTVWRRIHNDVNGAVVSYFRNYRSKCDSSNSTHSYGKSIRTMFPTKFVRNFHYSDAMRLPESHICANIQAEVDENVNAIIKNGAHWFESFQNLSEKWMIATLSKFPKDPAEMKITFVSYFSSSKKYSQVDENFEHQKFFSMLHFLRFYDNVVYTSLENSLKIRSKLISEYNWTEEMLGSLIFLESSERTLISNLLGSRSSALITKLLEIKNNTNIEAFEIISPFLMREVARLSLKGDLHQTKAANSTNFVWVDPQIPFVYNESGVLTNHTDHEIRGNVWLNPMVIGDESNSSEEVTEVLGNLAYTSEELSPNPRIVSGNTLGGSRMALEIFVGYYEMLLTWSLENGIIPRKNALATIISNIQRIDIPIQFAVFEDMSLKSKDSELFKYSTKCPISS